MTYTDDRNTWTRNLDTCAAIDGPESHPYCNEPRAASAYCFYHQEIGYGHGQKDEKDAGRRDHEGAREISYEGMPLQGLLDVAQAGIPDPSIPARESVQRLIDAIDVAVDALLRYRVKLVGRIHEED